MRLWNPFRAALPVVDEEWYLSCYPDVRSAVADGRVASAAEHYRTYGQREKRLPTKPVVDEAWYLLRYPDVGRLIRTGRVKSAFDHFVQAGYSEGRLPQHPPSTKRGA
jgi:hypothetical protein